MTHEIMRGKATYTLFIFGRLERCADVSNKIKLYRLQLLPVTVAD